MKSFLQIATYTLIILIYNLVMSSMDGCEHFSDV